MLTSVSQVVTLGNLPDEGNEERISEYMLEAQRQLKVKIGETLYLALEAEDGTGEYAEDKTRLAQAEAFLTLAEMIPVMNLRINPNDGGIVRSVGFGESKNELINFSDTQAIADYFRDKADTIVAEYVEIDDDDDEEIGVSDNVGWFAV